MSRRLFSRHCGSGRPAFWARVLRCVPNAKFAATEAAYRASVDGDARTLMLENLEFTWRYYARLVLLLWPPYRERLRRRVQVQGASRLSRALESEVGAVLVSTHLGELEVAGAWLAQACGREVVVVVDEVTPWWRQLFFDRVRRACGVRLRRQGATSLDELAADLGAGRIVLLMLDRRSSPATVMASFMGRPSALPLAPWALSLRAEAPVLTGTTVRSRSGGCTIRFGIPHGANAARQHGAGWLTRRLASDLECAIRSAPSQWHVPADLCQLPFGLSQPDPLLPTEADRGSRVAIPAASS